MAAPKIKIKVKAPVKADKPNTKEKAPEPAGASESLDFNADDLPDKKPEAATKIVTLDALSGEFNKTYGTNAAYKGSKVEVYRRMPYGVYNLDFISGGGAAINHTTCLWGPWSGGKTSTALNSIAVAQRLCFRCLNLADYCTCSEAPLKKKAVYVAVEGDFDRDWAAKIGVNLDELLVIKLDYAEQYSDAVPRLIAADDCGALVFDSVGALSTKADLEKGAEASNMGVGPRVITRLVTNAKQALITKSRSGGMTAVIYINQLRTNLGVTFGSPDTTKGGNAFMHDQSMNIFCNKNALSSKGGEATLKGSNNEKDRGAKLNTIINKAKIRTNMRSAQFLRASDYVHPQYGRIDGRIIDFTSVVGHALSIGVIGDSKYIEVMGVRYKTQKELASALATNKELYWQFVQNATLNYVVG